MAQSSGPLQRVGKSPSVKNYLNNSNTSASDLNISPSLTSNTSSQQSLQRDHIEAMRTHRQAPHLKPLISPNKNAQWVSSHQQSANSNSSNIMAVNLNLNPATSMNTTQLNPTTQKQSSNSGGPSMSINHINLMTPVSSLQYTHGATQNNSTHQSGNQFPGGQVASISLIGSLSSKNSPSYFNSSHLQNSGEQNSSILGGAKEGVSNFSNTSQLQMDSILSSSLKKNAKAASKKNLQQSGSNHEKQSPTPSSSSHSRNNSLLLSAAKGQILQQVSESRSPTSSTKLRSKGPRGKPIPEGMFNSPIKPNITSSNQTQMGGLSASAASQSLSGSGLSPKNRKESAKTKKLASVGSNLISSICNEGDQDEGMQDCDGQDDSASKIQMLEMDEKINSAANSPPFNLKRLQQNQSPPQMNTEGDIFSEGSTIFHQKKGSAQQNTVANSIPLSSQHKILMGSSSNPSSASHQKKRHTADKKMQLDEDKLSGGLKGSINTLSFDNQRSAVVKRGKVNLSQHEKINLNSSQDTLPTTSLHNTSLQGASSLNNTLQLQKQSSTGGKKQQTKLLQGGYGSLTGVSSTNFNNTQTFGLNSLPHTIKFEQHKSQSAYQSPTGNALNKAVRPNIFAKQKSSQEQSASQGASGTQMLSLQNQALNSIQENQSLQSTRHAKKASNQPPMITSYLSQQNSSKSQGKANPVFNFNSSNNNTNNSQNQSIQQNTGGAPTNIKNSHSSPNGKKPSATAINKYQSTLQSNSQGKQPRSHIIKKQPSSTTSHNSSTFGLKPKTGGGESNNHSKLIDSSSKISSQNASLNFTINNTTTLQAQANNLASHQAQTIQSDSLTSRPNSQTQNTGLLNSLSSVSNNNAAHQLNGSMNSQSQANKKTSLMMKGVKSLQIEIPEEILNKHRQSSKIEASSLSTSNQKTENNLNNLSGLNDTSISTKSEKRPIKNLLASGGNAASKQSGSLQVSQLTTPKALDLSGRAANNLSTSSEDKKIANQKQSPQSIQQQFQMMAEYPLQPAHKIIIPNHEPTKCSVKRNGVVVAYAANTNQGIIRTYNEDRVSIILNILKPANRANEEWPKCSFFGIYDGHGGSGCADFLRDNLHQFVIKEPSFPWNPKEAIRNGFAKAEKKFIELNYNPETDEVQDKSGSCAITILIIGDVCFAANVGDSRALLSGSGGQKIYPLSRDHKPSDENERKRIIEAGGQIYQTATSLPSSQMEGGNSKKEMIIGPQRVLPGRLSVCRTFGDIEAKIEKRGGNPNVVVAIPEIKSFRISEDHDFIVIASDGIFDKLSNQESIECVWNSVRDVKSSNVHQQAGLGVEYIIKNALLRRTLDNVTVVVVGFENFQRIAFGSTFTNETEPQNAGNTTDVNVQKKLRNPQLNNTHTQGIIKDSRKILGGANYKSGIQTPTNNILERSIRTQSANHEDSKISDNNASNSMMLNQSKISQQNSHSIHNPRMGMAGLGVELGGSGRLNSGEESGIIGGRQGGKNTSYHNTVNINTSDLQINLNNSSNLNGISSLITTKQLISPHAIASKFQSISTKNDEIKSRVKHFDFTQ